MVYTTCDRKKPGTRFYRYLLAAILPGLLLTTTAMAQAPAGYTDVSPARDDPQRTAIIEPFRIIDNIYSVSGVVHDPVYLIVTDEGHLLIDTSFEWLVPAIVNNIEKLGFRVQDIRYLLAAHAHVDHVEGHALMQEISGATLLSTEGDKDVMESGGRTDFRDGDLWPPVKVDGIVNDLEELRLGDTVLTAHITPGHTKGCTTWTTTAEENGRQYDVVFFCGMRMNPGEPLMDNPDYPQMAQDFAYSFAKLKTLPVDIYLASHGYWFNLAGKIETLESGPPINPFIDPEGYHYTVDRFEKAYLDALARERGITDQ